jgi:hypothetical protein
MAIVVSFGASGIAKILAVLGVSVDRTGSRRRAIAIIAHNHAIRAWRREGSWDFFDR